MNGLSISELARCAGVSVRTIRYYVSEGLLPAASTKGRYAVYGSGHLNRLKLIAQLKEAFLPLSEIRARLSVLSDSKVSALLEDEAFSDSVDLRIATASESLLPDTDEVDETVEPHLENVDHSYFREAELGDAPQPGHSSETHAEALGRFLKDRPSDRNENRQRPASDASASWIRYRMEDGIELNVRMPLHPWRKRVLARLLTELRAQLRDW